MTTGSSLGKFMKAAASRVDQAFSTLRSGLSSAAATACLPQKRGRFGLPPVLPLFLRAMGEGFGATLPSPQGRGGKSCSPFGVERVAGAAHCADQVRLAQRQPKPPDMHVDGAQLDVLAVRPDGFQQLLAREDA